MLIELPDYLDFCFLLILIAFLILASIYLLIRVSVRRNISKAQSAGHADGKIFYSFVFSAFVIVLLSWLAFFFYRDIIALLKDNSLTTQLGKLSYSPKETFYIFIAFSAVLGLVMIFCLTYAVSKSVIPGLIGRLGRRILSAGSLRPLGAVIFAILLILNILIPLYRQSNKPQGPNVVLILIDTLRADHLGAYGYKRDTSPNIDEFAREGVLFRNAYAQTSWTYPSVASIQTSLYPSQIGEFGSKRRLSDSLLTIAEYMKNNFYKTIAVVSNVYVANGFGFSQGFDIFDQNSILNPDSITSQLVTDKAIEYLNKYGHEPFFIWVHYMDPHTVYVHHPEYGYRKESTSNITVRLTGDELNKITNSLGPDDVQFIIDTYDEEISYTDGNFGRLIDAVKELGLERNTVIILSSDHGEEFLERRRFGHAASLYNEIIRVPLIIYNPLDNNNRGTVIDRNVEIRNIARTITETCGLPDNGFGGENLYGMLEDNGGEGVVFSQQSSGNMKTISQKAAIMGRWKIIEKMNENTIELYDLGTDRGEKRNLYGSDGIGSVPESLVSAIKGFNPDVVAHSEITQHNYEDIKKIKALGYVE